MQLIAWFFVSLSAAVALRHRPFPLLMSALVLWCLLPGGAAHLVVGHPMSGMTLHPAAVLILAMFVVQVCVHPGKAGAAVAARFEMYAMLATPCVVAVALGLMAHGLMSFGMALEQLCAPVAAFLLVGLCVRQHPGRVGTIHGVVVGVAAMEAALALAQFAFQSPLLFTSDYESQSWFRSTFGRWMGTLDHPLVLGLLLAVAVPLLSGVRRTWALAPGLVLLLAGLVVTQSRVGLMLGSLGAVYLLASRRSKAGAAMVALLLLGAGLYAQQAGYFEALTARVADDTGSAAARSYAWSYFLDHLADFSWLGGGMGSSYNTSDKAGIGTSFENSFVMYAIDLGLIPAVMYFGVMLACCIRAFRDRVSGGLPLAAAAAFIAPLTFSGLSSRSAASCLVWVVFAAAAYGPGRISGQRRVASGNVESHETPPGSAGRQTTRTTSAALTGSVRR